MTPEEKLSRSEEKRAKEMERKMSELIAAVLRDGAAMELR
jgi:hypothetical protein